MSIYRFLRTSALLALARRYRQKLFAMGVAIALALTTSWLYGDIARYLETQHPQWLLLALLTKTLIVYGVLVYLVWQLRPSAWSLEPKAQELPPAASTAPLAGPLDELLDKPRLKTRRQSLLDEVEAKGE